MVPKGAVGHDQIAAAGFHAALQTCFSKTGQLPAMMRFLVLASVLGFLATFGWTIAKEYIPETADLAEVRGRVAEPLERQMAAKDLALGAPVFLRIFKEEAVLEVWVQKGDAFERFRTYDICAFSGELGPKLREGDEQAPEGFYTVGLDALNPASRYHLSFNLGFPNAYDRSLGRSGSFLMVHGKCVSIGCFAMTDLGIEEIYLIVEAALKGGQAEVPVHIFPFRMTAENLAAHEASKWREFWANLADGYYRFEETALPPKVSVEDKRYRFDS